MADITLVVADAHLPRVIEAFCAHFDYDETKLEGETQGQFTKRMVAQMAKNITLTHERKAAEEAALVGLSEVDVQ